MAPFSSNVIHSDGVGDKVLGIIGSEVVPRLLTLNIDTFPASIKVMASLYPNFILNG